jgi:hypothetical protein
MANFFLIFSFGRFNGASLPSGVVIMLFYSKSLAGSRLMMNTFRVQETLVTVDLHSSQLLHSFARARTVRAT